MTIEAQRTPKKQKKSEELRKTLKNGKKKFSVDISSILFYTFGILSFSSYIFMVFLRFHNFVNEYGIIPFLIILCLVIIFSVYLFGFYLNKKHKTNLQKGLDRISSMSEFQSMRKIISINCSHQSFITKFFRFLGIAFFIFLTLLFYDLFPRKDVIFAYFITLAILEPVFFFLPILSKFVNQQITLHPKTSQITIKKSIRLLRIWKPAKIYNWADMVDDRTNNCIKFLPDGFQVSIYKNAGEYIDIVPKNLLLLRDNDEITRIKALLSLLLYDSTISRRLFIFNLVSWILICVEIWSLLIFLN